MLSDFGAVLFLAAGLPIETAILVRMEKVIPLFAAVVGIMFLVIALKNRNAAPALSIASGIAALMLGSGGLGFVVMTKLMQRHKPIAQA
jgi:hypothetical protein